jgi:hypothetical protein
MSDTPTSRDKNDPASKPEESVDRARRRLLAMSLYVPPTVLGIISLQQAGCQAGPSCNPAQCAPDTGCAPDVGCPPDNGCPPDTGCNPDTCPPNN